MNNIKLSLTITLPGRVMMSRKEARKNFQENYEHYSLELTVPYGRDSKGEMKYTKETIKFHTRKCIPATQVINMTQEAYDYMMDKKECPEWFLDKTHNAKDWAKLTNEQRLRLHLKRTCEHLGGSHFSYVVFPD